jgi:two-component system cell cycle response regulator DivK
MDGKRRAEQREQIHIYATLMKVDSEDNKEKDMGKTILIVEDEPRNLKLLRDLLQRFGYEILEASDGEQGVKSAGEKMPDLILMDIMMPKMDGLEATRIIKADTKTKHIPIIALTSYAMKGDREKTIEAGCDGYIAKPIDIKEVLKTIETYLTVKQVSV